MSWLRRTTEIAPRKHVIEEYRHREQRVTCICGWTGSTKETATTRSEWKEHLAQMRGKPS